MLPEKVPTCSFLPFRVNFLVCCPNGQSFSAHITLFGREGVLPSKGRDEGSICTAETQGPVSTFIFIVQSSFKVSLIAVKRGDCAVSDI